MVKISDVETILLNEVDNNQNVYLYLEGDNWCAYERSAYYLSTMNLPVDLVKEIIYDGYDVILIKALFNTKAMRLPLSHFANLRSVADESLLFQMDTSIEGFIEWKGEKLSGM